LIAISKDKPLTSNQVMFLFAREGVAMLNHVTCFVFIMGSTLYMYLVIFMVFYLFTRLAGYSVNREE